MIELGYRGQLSENLQVDVEGFVSEAKNFAAAISQPTPPVEVRGPKDTTKST